MMQYSSKLGGIMATGGAIVGIVVGMKQKSTMGATAFYAVVFAGVGYLLGNQITKFYE